MLSAWVEPCLKSPVKLCRLVSNRSSELFKLVQLLCISCNIHKMKRVKCNWLGWERKALGNESPTILGQEVGNPCSEVANNWLNDDLFFFSLRLLPSICQVFSTPEFVSKISKCYRLKADFWSLHKGFTTRLYSYLKMVLEKKIWIC